MFTILSILDRAGAENDPRQALQHLLADCVRETEATAGRLYLLDLAQTAYLQMSAIGRSGDSSISLLSRTGQLEDGDALLRAAIQKLSILNVEQLPDRPEIDSDIVSTHSRLIVPIVRDHACLGVFDLESDEAHHFNKDHENGMRIAALVAMLVREKADVLDLLRELQVPVDYHQGFDAFLDDLMVLIVAASKSPRVSLRELRDEDTLYCLTSYGFSNQTDEELHLSPISEYPLFAQVVATRQAAIARRKDGPLVQETLEKLKQDDVESFIILPVLVGHNVFGTLSFAVHCDHEYTVLEQQGLQAIANATGIAISNYRNFHLAEDRLFSQAQVAAAITTVDVAQSARHEARNHLQHATESLALLVGKLSSAQTKGAEEMRSTIDKMSDQLGGVEIALQKIKTITKPPDKEKRVMRLDKLWENTFALTVGRLAQQQIEWNIKGNAMVNVAHDYIQTAFLNLVINSIDAFKGSKKKGRVIDVTIEPPSEKATDVVMRYVDNATGIDPSRLSPAPGDAVRAAVDIFQPGVTSKVDGSGYGLYLVRKILTDHRGSISLLDHRNGIVFQIKLPQASAATTEGKT